MSVWSMSRQWKLLDPSVTVYLGRSARKARRVQCSHGNGVAVVDHGSSRLIIIIITSIINSSSRGAVSVTAGAMPKHVV